MRTFREHITEIEVIDRWTGYSDLSPTVKSHRIERIQGRLVGKSKFTIASDSNASAPIAVAGDVEREFFDTLLDCPITLGRYRPALFYTDSYPHTTIVITIERPLTLGVSTEAPLAASTTAGVIRIVSESQAPWIRDGTGWQARKPWEVETDSVQWAIGTAGPAQALALLEKVLNGAVFDSLYEQAELRLYGSRKAK